MEYLNNEILIRSKPILLCFYLTICLTRFLSAEEIAIKFYPENNTQTAIFDATYDSVGNCYYMAVTNRSAYKGFTGLVKLDKCGNVIWYKHYDNIKGVNSYSCTLISPNIISLTTIDQSLPSIDDKGSNIFVDSSGNVITQLTVKISRRSHSAVLKGNYINYIASGDYGKAIYGIDNSGNVMWAKQLTSTDVLFTNSSIYTETVNSRGNLVVLLTNSPYNFMVEIDNNGSVLNQCKISNIYSPYYNLSAYSDGIYLQYNGAGSIENYGKSVAKFDNDFNLLWAKEFYSTNGIDRTTPIFNYGYNFPYSLNLNDGIFYADFTSYLTGAYEYNLVGLNTTTGQVISHNTFEKGFFQSTHNNLMYGLILEDSASSFYRSFLLSGKESILHNCHVKPANNVSVKDIPLIVSPVAGFVSTNDTSGLERYSSYSISSHSIASSFLCDSINIGNDTSVCTFKNYYLTIKDSSKFQKVIWNTGDTLFHLLITKPGKYIATVFNTCGLRMSDSINIYQTLKTKRDTSFNFCLGDTLIYNHKKYFNQGVFFDTILSIQNCDTMQKIQVNLYPRYNFTYHDTICEGERFNNAILFSDTLITNHLFSSKGCDSTINYNIKVNKKASSTQNIQLCRFSFFNGIAIQKDTLIIMLYLNSEKCDSSVNYVIKVMDSIHIQIDTSICIGDVFQSEYYKRDTIIRIVNKSVYNCDSITYYNIIVKKAPEIIIKDSIESDSLILLKATGALSYIWNTNNTSDTILINSFFGGLYYVMGTDNNGCQGIDSINIPYKNIAVYIPTAFSPNNDGVNDELGVMTSSPIPFNLKIFNRWGQLIFESNSIQDKWNGTYHNESMPVDNYLYILETQMPNGKKYLKQGTITLLK